MANITPSKLSEIFDFVKITLRTYTNELIRPPVVVYTIHIVFVEAPTTTNERNNVYYPRVSEIVNDVRLFAHSIVYSFNDLSMAAIILIPSKLSTKITKIKRPGIPGNGFVPVSLYSFRASG